MNEPINENGYIIYGAGKMSKSALQFATCLGLLVVGFCDSNKLVVSSIEDLPIITPYELDMLISNNKIMGIIIGSSIYDDEIYEKLLRYVEVIKVIKFHEIQKQYINTVGYRLKDNVTEEYIINYKEQINIWIDNLMSEVEFWACETASPKGKNHSSYISRIESSNDQFICDRLKMQVDEKTIILDVGCGIFSKYGKYKGESRLSLEGIDPLAHFYNKINEHYGISEIVRFGLFEFLSIFVENSQVDVILIDNALDHCIDPYKSILECLKVLKVGGCLSTRHRRCEALFENFQGLHKWNIDVDDDNNIIIWNLENKINVSKKLEQYVDIETVYSEADEMLEIAFILKNEIPKEYYVKENEMLLAFILERLMNKYADSNNRLFEEMLGL